MDDVQRDDLRINCGILGRASLKQNRPGTVSFRAGAQDR
jgi:hypothetical protein